MALKVSWDSGGAEGTRLEYIRWEMELRGGKRTVSQVEGTACATCPPGSRRWRRRGSGTSRVSSRPLQSALLRLPFQNDINASLLNDYVLGAQLGHEHVNNLSEPINISFWHNQSLVLGGCPISTPPLPPYVLLNIGLTKLKPGEPSWKQTVLNSSLWKFLPEKEEKLLLTVSSRLL